jgi:hypothetical protein
MSEFIEFWLETYRIMANAETLDARVVRDREFSTGELDPAEPQEADQD